MAEAIDPVEEALLNALTDRLERALDLASGASVLERLGEVSGLACDAAALADAGHMVLRGQK